MKLWLKAKCKWFSFYLRPPTSPTSSKAWIEKLLEMAISDYKKTVRDLILIPYLIVDKAMTDRDKIYDIVMAWADKCDQLRKLQPSRSEFSKKVMIRIDSILGGRGKRIPPMTLKRTKQKCPCLYEELLKTHRS